VNDARPPDVLHLIWSGGIGGIERSVEALISQAPRHEALLLDGVGPIGDALIACGRARRVGMRGGADAAGLARLAAALRRRPPGVIHAQTHALLALLVARLAAPRTRWIYTEQSPRILGTDRKFGLLYRFLRAAGARLVAPSVAVAAAMRSHLPSDAQVTVVPNPCLVPVAAEDRPLRDPPVIGVVARLEPQKSIEDLLEVLAALRRGGTSCRGLIVGGGSCEPALRRRSAELDLDGEVEFTGPRLEVATWLDQLDVFLATSVSEPFGIAAVEAMARRVPVVAMPCPGGLVELVGEGGLLLGDRRIETAADAVARLLTSASHRRELRERGVRVAERCAPVEVLRQLERLYAPPEGDRSGPPVRIAQ
jgi:glycosyltransferase involved in cell wall biosynthesis